MTSKVLQKPIVISASVHFFVAAVVLVLSFVSFKTVQQKKIDFTVFVQEEPKAPARLIEPQTKLVPLAKKMDVKPRAVFGLSKNTLTTDQTVSNGPSVEVKLGNTVAKEQDSDTLNPEDESSLPNPTDEFLVSNMPILVSEVRIPYPKQARDASVEGPVVMELLIDDSGKVRKVILISGPGFGLNEAALQAVQGFIFKPAKVDNQSVAVKIRYTYRFVLETR